MITGVAPLTQQLTPLKRRPLWQALESHYKVISGRHLRDLFANDPTRGDRLTLEAGGLFLDFSKNRVSAAKRCSAARRLTSARNAPFCMFPRARFPAPVGGAV